MPRLRKSIIRKCFYCKNTFNAAISEVKRGNGKFCSLSCVCHYRNIHYLKPRAVKLVSKTCNFCNKKFQHRPYKGLGKYCSIICKNNSRRGKKPGSPNQNIRRKCKNLAFTSYGEKCEVCEYALAVDVHHLIPRSEGGKDEAYNLAVLCPNHHREVHIGIIATKDILEIRKNKVEMTEYGSVSSTTFQKHLQA